jgi:hypothetical protein
MSQKAMRGHSRRGFEGNVWIGSFSGSFIVLSFSSPKDQISTSLPRAGFEACSATLDQGSTRLVNELTHEMCTSKPSEEWPQRLGTARQRGAMLTTA